MLIRNETPSDIDEITQLTIAAFKTLPISRNTEHFIVKALRAAGALTLSLVAEMEGHVVGHIAFSPITIADGSQDWYGIGPLSVLPAYHRKGIGKRLMNEGLSRLKDLGGQGCALVGDPNYYKQFGFRNIPGLIHEGVPPEAFLILPFSEKIPQGIVLFHEAFSATE